MVKINAAVVKVLPFQAGKLKLAKKKIGKCH